jgi:hypothetical protein
MDEPIACPQCGAPRASPLTPEAETLAAQAGARLSHTDATRQNRACRPGAVPNVTPSP